MEAINNYVARINALPNSKKLILLLIFVIVVFILIELVSAYINSKNNIVNHSKIQQFKNKDADDEDEDDEDDEDEDEEEDAPDNKKPKKISLHGDKLNITLYFAHWCGHCKKFIKDTWKDLKKKYKDDESVQLNDIDCTNIKSRITTPKGKDIEGFPSVVVNYKDKAGELYEEEYKGGRSSKHLETFIAKMVSKLSK